MKNIRRGNDIRFRWQIRRGEDAESFDGKDISVVLRDQFGNSCDVEWSIADGGIISGVSRGKTQSKLGVYTLTLVENDGANDMATVDKISAWRLVAVQDASLVDDEATNDCGNISVEVIELESEIGLGSLPMSIDTELNPDSDNAIANSAVTKGINAVGEMTEEEIQEVVNGESMSLMTEEPTADTGTQNITRKSGLQYYTSLLKGSLGKEIDKKADSAYVDEQLNGKATLDEVKAKVQGGAWLCIRPGSGSQSIIACCNDANNAYARSEGSFALGVGANAEGNYSFAHGSNVHAGGEWSHAEGASNNARSIYSHAEGYGTNAGARAAHSEGAGTAANHDYSHTEGFFTQSTMTASHSEGYYNYYTLDKCVSSIGVGIAGKKLNARVVIYNSGQPNNGYMYLLGVGGYEGQGIEDGMKSVQEVIKDHETDIAELKTINISQYSTTEEIKKNLATGEWLPLQEGLGEKSIIIGNQTTATGQYAFASGLSTQATGIYSHAEGVFSVASGNYSHAEGSNAKPKGEYSHAEGERTEIASQGGHAEGVCTYLNANEDVIHHVGVGYYNDKLSTDVILRKYGDAKNGYQYMMGIGGYNGKDITDSTQSLQEVVADYGQRITSTEGSVATLNDSVAILTSNISDQSTKIDNINDRFASYVPTSAKGAANGVATLDGNGQVPVSQLGNVDTELFLVVTELPTENIKTNKVYLVPSGKTEQGNVYTEWVYVNNAWEKLGEYKPEVDLSAYSTTEQIKTNVQNGMWLPIRLGAFSNSIVLCDDVVSTGDLKCLATGEAAIAHGYRTKATGNASHAEGEFDVIASGGGSHAEGSTTTASGNYSHAEGALTKAQKTASHAEGWNTTASGEASHAEGYNTTALGRCSHAEGDGTHADGEYSHAEGMLTRTPNRYSHAEGVQNYYSIPNAISYLGIGTASTAPQVFLNACVVIWNYGQPDNGYIYIRNIGGYGGQAINDAKSLQQVINSHEQRLDAISQSQLELISVGNGYPFILDGTAKTIDKKRRMKFTGFTNLTAANSDTNRSWLVFANVSNYHGTDMTRMFYACSSLRELDVRDWDVSAVTMIRSAFHGCTQLEKLDVSGWDTRSMRVMSYAFCNCQALQEIDARGWDTSATTEMDGVFSGCANIQTILINGWDTSHATTTAEMFSGCSSLTWIDIQNCDMSAVTTMDFMFYNCSSLRSLKMNNCSLDHVKSMSYCFANCGEIEELILGEGFGKVLNAVGSIDFRAMTKWTGESVQTLLNLFNRTAHASEGFRTITLQLSTETKAALGTAGIQTLTSRGYTIA